MQTTTTAQPQQNQTITDAIPNNHYITGVELTASVIAIGLAVIGWVRAELNTKRESAEAEASIIKSLRQELADKDEEIDRQRIKQWQLEKEIRLLRQAMEFSGQLEPSQKDDPHSY